MQKTEKQEQNYVEQCLNKELGAFASEFELMESILDFLHPEIPECSVRTENN